jgi:hypothetical protein
MKVFVTCKKEETLNPKPQVTLQVRHVKLEVNTQCYKLQVGITFVQYKPWTIHHGWHLRACFLARSLGCSKN